MPFVLRRACGRTRRRQDKTQHRCSYVILIAFWDPATSPSFTPLRYQRGNHHRHGSCWRQQRHHCSIERKESTSGAIPRQRLHDNKRREEGNGTKYSQCYDFQPGYTADDVFSGRSRACYARCKHRRHYCPGWPANLRHPHRPGYCNTRRR